MARNALLLRRPRGSPPGTLRGVLRDGPNANPGRTGDMLPVCGTPASTRRIHCEALAVPPEKVKLAVEATTGSSRNATAILSRACYWWPDCACFAPYCACRATFALLIVLCHRCCGARVGPRPQISSLPQAPLLPVATLGSRCLRLTWPLLWPVGPSLHSPSVAWNGGTRRTGCHIQATARYLPA